MCFQVMRIEFTWQSCNYSATIGPMVVSCHVRSFETLDFTLFALIHLLFFQTQHFSLSKYHTPTFHFTLPPSNFLLSLFFPWKIQYIRSGEAVQSKTRVDHRRTRFITSGVFCQFSHFGSVLQWWLQEFYLGGSLRNLN